MSLAPDLSVALFVTTFQSLTLTQPWTSAVASFLPTSARMMTLMSGWASISRESWSGKPTAPRSESPLPGSGPV